MHHNKETTYICTGLISSFPLNLIIIINLSFERDSPLRLSFIFHTDHIYSYTSTATIHSLQSSSTQLDYTTLLFHVNSTTLFTSISLLNIYIAKIRTFVSLPLFQKSARPYPTGASTLNHFSRCHTMSLSVISV